MKVLAGLLKSLALLQVGSPPSRLRAATAASSLRRTKPGDRIKAARKRPWGFIQK
jgi:hypothetical protein